MARPRRAVGMPTAGGAAMIAEWSARLYLTFEDERTRPARDLVAQIPLEAARRVVDLGCGPGNSTEILAARYPEADVIGIDSSPDMLAAARRRMPHTSFIQADVRTYRLPEPADVILANAVLNWVPDHRTLFPRLVSQLSDGGVLAIQLPDNLSEPVHETLRAMAEGAWARQLSAVPRARIPLLRPEEYYDLLSPIAGKVEMWRTVYCHPLADHAALMEWMRGGGGLQPYLDALAPAERPDFLAAYEERLARVYPRRADGRVLLYFPRLFIVVLR